MSSVFNSFAESTATAYVDAPQPPRQTLRKNTKLVPYAPEASDGVRQRSLAANEVIYVGVDLPNMSGERELTQTEIAEFSDDLPPAELVRRLSDSSLPRSERRRLITEAEFARFEAVEWGVLSLVLRKFIEAHRDSSDPEDIVAVASAIRSYVANMNADDLSTVSLLLDAGSRTPVSLDVELEVAKMVVRKLTANPPRLANEHSTVASLLADLAETYAKDRLLAREKIGAIALNSLIGLVLLHSDSTREQIERLCKLKSDWFRELFVRRLRGIREEWRQRFAHGTISPNIEFIDKMISDLEVKANTRAV